MTTMFYFLNLADLLTRPLVPRMQDLVQHFVNDLEDRVFSDVDKMREIGRNYFGSKRG